MTCHSGCAATFCNFPPPNFLPNYLAFSVGADPRVRPFYWRTPFSWRPCGKPLYAISKPQITNTVILSGSKNLVFSVTLDPSLRSG
jgi:hypothetical protein